MNTGVNPIAGSNCRAQESGCSSLPDIYADHGTEELRHEALDRTWRRDTTIPADGDQSGLDSGCREFSCRKSGDTGQLGI